jgi:hypothetical protein
MDRSIPTDKSGVLHVLKCDTELYPRNQYATLPQREPRNSIGFTVISYTENPLVCRKLSFAEATIILLTYSIIFFTRIFVRATYFLKYNLVS